jgi:hypothetical protein
VSLKGLGAETNWLALNRQSECNFDFDYELRNSLIRSCSTKLHNYGVQGKTRGASPVHDSKNRERLVIQKKITVWTLVRKWNCNTDA